MHCKNIETLIALAFDQSRVCIYLFKLFCFNKGIERSIATLISRSRLARNNSVSLNSFGYK